VQYFCPTLPLQVKSHSYVSNTVHNVKSAVSDWLLSVDITRSIHRCTLVFLDCIDSNINIR
jgi:hypothetical protein